MTKIAIKVAKSLTDGASVIRFIIRFANVMRLEQEHNPMPKAHFELQTNCRRLPLNCKRDLDPIDLRTSDRCEDVSFCG